MSEPTESVEESNSWETSPLNVNSVFPQRPVSPQKNTGNKVVPPMGLKTVHNGYGSINIAGGEEERVKEENKNGAANDRTVATGGHESVVLDEYQLIELAEAMRKIKDILDSAKSTPLVKRRK